METDGNESQRITFGTASDLIAKSGLEFVQRDVIDQIEIVGEFPDFPGRRLEHERLRLCGDTLPILAEPFCYRNVTETTRYKLRIDAGAVHFESASNQGLARVGAGNPPPRAKARRFSEPLVNQEILGRAQNGC